MGGGVRELGARDQGGQEDGLGGLGVDPDALAGAGVGLGRTVRSEDLDVDDGRGVVGVGEVDVVLAPLGRAHRGEPEVGAGCGAADAEHAAGPADRDLGGQLRGPAGGEDPVGAAGEGGGVGAAGGGPDGLARLLGFQHRLGVLGRAEQPGRSLALAGGRAGSEGRVRGLGDVRGAGPRAHQQGPLHRHPGGGRRLAVGRLPVGGGCGEGGDAGEGGQGRGHRRQRQGCALLHCWGLPSGRGSCGAWGWWGSYGWYGSYG